MVTYRSHIHHHIHHHAKRVVEHVKKHHHKYLLASGVASGTFLMVKIIMLFAASYTLYNAQSNTSFADEFTFSPLQEENIISNDSSVSAPTVQETSPDLLGSQQISDLLLANQSQDSLSLPQEDAGTGLVETGNTQTLVDSGTNQTGTQNSGSIQQPQPEVQPTFTVCSYDGFSSNIVGNQVYSGVMNISWTISPNCSDEIVDIQLYDHNEQWISLAQVAGNTTSYSFDTTLLGSGFYNQTGANGILLTGIYSGVAMNSWSGYRLRWIVHGDNILNETPNFSIDNGLPTLSNVSLTYSGSSSGFVGRGYLLTLAFDSSEVLSQVKVLLGSGAQATFVNLSGTHYTYNYVLPANFPSGAYIPYTISYADSGGFTGSLSGLSQLFFDATGPQMTGFALNGYNFSFTTTEPTRATLFVLIKNTSSGWAFSSSSLSTSHTFSLPTLSLHTEYDMGIIVKDSAGNDGKAAFSLARNNSGVIEYSLLATQYDGTMVTYATGSNFLSTTGVVASGTKDLLSIKDKFKNELNAFTVCKNSIKYSEIKLQVQGNQFTLHIPVFEQSDTKKIVNAFILYIMKSLESSPKLTQGEIEDIAQNFDNFTVILKFLREGNSQCKQNLSNSRLEQFKQSLKVYGIKL